MLSDVNFGDNTRVEQNGRIKKTKNVKYEYQYNPEIWICSSFYISKVSRLNFVENSISVELAYSRHGQNVAISEEME